MAETISSLNSAYNKKEEVEKPPLCDSLGVFVIPQEYLVSFYQNTLLIAILKALIIRDKYLIIRFF